MIHHIRLGKNATRLDPIRKKILAAVLLHGWYKRLRNNSILTEFFFSFLTTVHGGFFLTKDMQTPPPSVLIQFLWMIGGVLNGMNKIIKKKSDFYFSSYREKFIENWGTDVTKMTITRKIKIGKLIFHMFHQIPRLSC